MAFENLSSLEELFGLTKVKPAKTTTRHRREWRKHSTAEFILVSDYHSVFKKRGGWGNSVQRRKMRREQDRIDRLGEE